MIRLFWGVPCPPLPALRELQHGLYHSEAAQAGGLSVVPEHNLHVTLRYVGTVNESDVPAIRGCVQPLMASCYAVPLGLRGVGRFSQSLWVGVGAPSHLFHLVRQIDTALTEAGFPGDPKPFRPHVTVARLGRGVMVPASEWEKPHADRLFGEWLEDSVHLYRSDTGPHGSRYTPVASLPLRRD